MILASFVILYRNVIYLNLLSSYKCLCNFLNIFRIDKSFGHRPILFHASRGVGLDYPSERTSYFRTGK